MSENPETITVWLVEDNEIYRRGLARAIDSAEGMRCAEAFADAESALATIESSSPPDVILLDVGLPGMDGLSALKRFTTMAPDTRRLVQLTIDDGKKTDELLDMLLAKKRSKDRRKWLETKGNLAET